MIERVRVLLVDDYKSIRLGLRRLLELKGDFEVVGEAANTEEALHQARLLCPDVVVMDVRMPDSTGIEATRELQRERFPGKVIILTMYEGFGHQAVQAGASGYLLKTAKLEEIANGIHRVHEGGFVFPSAS